MSKPTFTNRLLESKRVNETKPRKTKKDCKCEAVDMDEFEPEYPFTTIDMPVVNGQDADVISYLQSSAQRNYEKYTHGKIDITNEYEVWFGKHVARIEGFSGNNNIVSATISRGTPVFGNETFMNCTNLDNFWMTEDLKIVPEAMFKNCTKLTRIVLDVTDIIGKEAFYGCSNLKFPENCPVKVIKERAFENAKLVNQMFLLAREIGDYAFANCNITGEIRLDSKKLKHVGKGIMSGQAYDRLVIQGNGDFRKVYSDDELQCDVVKLDHSSRLFMPLDAFGDGIFIEEKIIIDGVEYRNVLLIPTQRMEED